MKKIRVLHFAPYFPPHKGGLESHAAEWANAWIDREYGEVITLTSSLGQNGEIQKPQHTIIPLESFEIVPHFPVPKFWKGSFWNTLSRVKKEKPDIIITRTRFFLLSFLGGMCAKIWGIPWIHIEHGSGPVETDRLPVKIFSRIFDATLGWWIIRFSGRTIGISQACRLFIQSFGRSDDIPVIYRGVDFVPGKRITRNSKDSQTTNITFIGRLTYLKGVHILITALSKLGGDWHCTLVGDGEEREKLEQQVRDLHLTERVAFLGMKERKYLAEEVLPNTDIFMNPSFQEGLPTVVLEALLSRCRVIATDVGGTKEISEKEDLTIIPQDDVNALVTALEGAMIDYSEKSGQSYELVRKRFDWQENIQSYYTIISDVVDSLSRENSETSGKKVDSL
ncbi:glycosyltransferase family 4 protein [Candidatus Gracilibacteria bacterium]|nr:glycosyltransferase family 4 protein [Candidatus Gracilibacteria bacterium]